MYAKYIKSHSGVWSRDDSQLMHYWIKLWINYRSVCCNTKHSQYSGGYTGSMSKARVWAVRSQITYRDVSKENGQVQFSPHDVFNLISEIFNKMLLLYETERLLCGVVFVEEQWRKVHDCIKFCAVCICSYKTEVFALYLSLFIIYILYFFSPTLTF